ncbi:MAG: hypothetical protein WCC53_05370 [Thermoanaerobaculia bacterium]|jgi:hypothetical protein
MQIDLTVPECEYLKHLLDSARKELLHELHHTHGHEFKDTLKHQLDLNEKVSQKIDPKTKRG